MPYVRPGHIFYTVATKAVDHGLPCIETNIPGVSVKTRKPSSSVGSGAPQRNIAIGENFSMIIKGEVQVPNTGVGVAAANVGDMIYIIAATNLLTATAGTNPKFGVLTAKAGARGTPTGFCRVNLDLRDIVDAVV